jgi:hypothetical protein
MLIKGELRFIEILRNMGQFNPDRLDEIKEALLRGEKYEQMWGEFKKWVGADRLCPLSEKMKRDKEIHTIMEGYFEQKYFPKPKEKLIELMEELDKQVKKILEWGDYNES